MSAAIRPLTGGVRGHPFSLPEADLTACGYVAEEFVLEGTASSFGPAPGADFAVDGKWDVVVDEIGRVPHPDARGAAPRP